MNKMLSTLAFSLGIFVLLPLLIFASQPVNGGSVRGQYFVYFGTYTDKMSKGIYGYRFEPSTGKATSIGLVAETPYPAFLIVPPNQKYLYAVNFMGNDTTEGATVTGYTINNKTGKLTFLSRVESKGEKPTNMAIDHTGKMLIVVNYGGGSVTGYQIGRDGRLSEPTAFDQHKGNSVHRFPGPHAHGVVFSPDNHYAFVADVGLDRVYTYRVNPAMGTWIPEDPPFVEVTPGTAPRHLAIHPSGKFLYSNAETRNAILAFVILSGRLKQIQDISPVPEGYSGRNATSEIQVDQAGRFIYVSNRGHDSIAVFAVDQTGGTLTKVEIVPARGKGPRDFSLDPTGSYLFSVNQGSDNVALFRVEPASGRLTATGQSWQVPSPTSVAFVKAQ